MNLIAHTPSGSGAAGGAWSKWAGVNVGGETYTDFVSLAGGGFVGSSTSNNGGVHWQAGVGTSGANYVESPIAFGSATKTTGVGFVLASTIATVNSSAYYFNRNGLGEVSKNSSTGNVNTALTNLLTGTFGGTPPAASATTTLRLEILVVGGVTYLNSFLGTVNVGQYVDNSSPYATAMYPALVTNNGGTNPFTAYDSGSGVTFISGPPSIAMTSPTTATVSVAAANTGSGNYAYQWYKSTTAGFTPGAGSLVSGATSTTYNATGLTPGTPTYFACVVTDTGTSATATSNQVSSLSYATPPLRPELNPSSPFYSTLNSYVPFVQGKGRPRDLVKNMLPRAHPGTFGYQHGVEPTWVANDFPFSAPPDASAASGYGIHFRPGTKPLCYGYGGDTSFANHTGTDGTSITYFACFRPDFIPYTQGAYIPIVWSSPTYNGKTASTYWGDGLGIFRSGSTVQMGFTQAISGGYCSVCYMPSLAAPLVRGHTYLAAISMGQGSGTGPGGGNLAFPRRLYLHDLTANVRVCGNKADHQTYTAPNYGGPYAVDQLFSYGGKNGGNDLMINPGAATSSSFNGAAGSYEWVGDLFLAGMDEQFWDDSGWFYGIPSAFGSTDPFTTLLDDIWGPSRGTYATGSSAPTIRAAATTSPVANFQIWENQTNFVAGSATAGVPATLKQVGLGDLVASNVTDTQVTITASRPQGAPAAITSYSLYGSTAPGQMTPGPGNLIATQAVTPSTLAEVFTYTPGDTLLRQYVVTATDGSNTYTYPQITAACKPHPALNLATLGNSYGTGTGGMPQFHLQTAGASKGVDCNCFNFDWDGSGMAGWLPSDTTQSIGVGAWDAPGVNAYTWATTVLANNYAVTGRPIDCVFCWLIENDTSDAASTWASNFQALASALVSTGYVKCVVPVPYAPRQTTAGQEFFQGGLINAVIPGIDNGTNLRALGSRWPNVVANLPYSLNGQHPPVSLSRVESGILVDDLFNIMYPTGVATSSPTTATLVLNPSGTAGVASEWTVVTDYKVVGSPYAFTATVGAATFSGTIAVGSDYATGTYTRPAAGTYTPTLSATSGGSGITPAYSATSVAVSAAGSTAASGYGLYLPGATVGVAQTGVAYLDGGSVLGSPTVISLSGTGGGLPASVTIPASSESATFSYTPTATGTISVTSTNGSGLANPSGVSFIASASGAVTDASVTSDVTAALNAMGLNTSLVAKLNASTSTAGVVVQAQDTPLQRTGTAQGGSTTTITLDSGASPNDGSYFGHTITILSGTGSVSTRQITGYVGATKVATVHKPWTTAPDSTSIFGVYKFIGPVLDSSNDVTPTAASLGSLATSAMQSTILAAVGTPAQAGSLPANFASLGITSGGKITEVATVDTLTTYTGNTPQTGDSFARIGANGAGLTTLATASSLGVLISTVGVAGAGLTAIPGSGSGGATAASIWGDPMSNNEFSVPGSVGAAVKQSLTSNGAVLAAAGLDNVQVEPGINARQALSPMLAALAGVLSGAGTGTIIIKGGNSSTTRITAITDNSGNRSSLTLALPS